MRLKGENGRGCLTKYTNMQTVLLREIERHVHISLEKSNGKEEEKREREKMGEEKDVHVGHGIH